MKKNSKLLAFILAGVLVIAVFTACNDETKTDTIEPPQPVISQEWKVDLTNHWHPVSNGEKADIAAHELDENDVCAVCEYQIIDYNDGSYDISKFDEHGNTEFTESHADDGNICITSYEYVYDDNGNVLNEKTYVDSELFSESTYVIDNEGYPALHTNSIFAHGDSALISEYNIQGDMIRFAEYDAVGNVSNETIYHYEYDENNETIAYKAFLNEELSEEFEYVYNDEGLTYPAKMTYYSEDGTSEVTEQDADYNTLREAVYAADGSVITETVFEYTYDNEGNVILTKAFVDGVLRREIEGDYDADGWVYDAKETTYYEDGTVNITEYDPSYNEISNITYDSEGNILENNSDVELDSIIEDALSSFDFVE